MAPFSRTIPLFAVIAMMALAPIAFAGWVTVKNDTTGSVTVQETVIVNGIVRKCKPVKLAAGETLREFQPKAGTKTIGVVEAGLFGKTLYTGDLKWADGDSAFAIAKDGDKVQVAAIVDAPKPGATRAQSPEIAKAPMVIKPR